MTVLYLGFQNKTRLCNLYSELFVVLIDENGFKYSFITYVKYLAPQKVNHLSVLVVGDLLQLPPITLDPKSTKYSKEIIKGVSLKK